MIEHTHKSKESLTKACPTFESESNRQSIIFPYGIPGFEHFTLFYLREVQSSTAFYFLQAQEEPAIRLILMDAHYLKIKNHFDVWRSELDRLGLANRDDIVVFVVIKIDKNKQQLTANLKAPIIIFFKEKKGYQVIFEAEELSVNYQLEE